MTTIDNLLETYRAATITERDKGTYFERLCAAFLTADPVQREQYEAIWTWIDWANGVGFYIWRSDLAKIPQQIACWGYNNLTI